MPGELHPLLRAVGLFHSFAENLYALTVAAADFHDTATDGEWGSNGLGIAVDTSSPGSPNVYTTGLFHATKSHVSLEQA